MKPTHKKLLWGLCSILGLGLMYWLCRYVCFAVHGMGDWPNILAAVGLLVLIPACVKGKRLLSAGIVLGYPAGFIFGALFNATIDYHGRPANTYWFIWTAVFLLCILIGFVADILLARKQP